MATLRYRKDRKKWEVDYRRRGVRFKRLFSSKKTGAEFRRKVEEMVEREQSGMSYVEPIAFKDFVELFLQNHFAEKSDSYKYKAHYQIKGLMTPYFKDKEMSEITIENVIAWKDWRENRGKQVAPKTLREDLVLLKLIFKAAIKNNFATFNPVDDVEIPKNVPIKIRKAVSDEKLEQACLLMGDMELKVALLLRNTGMRLGELFRLEMEDVNFETKTITIKSVKGGTTKNYQSRETVLTPTSEKIIQSLSVKSGPLFLMKQRTFEWNFHKFKKRAGVDWDLHSLRHSFITQLRNENIPERTVAHFVGHAQKGMTDHYTSYTSRFIEKAIEVIDFGSEFLEQTRNVVPRWSPTPTVYKVGVGNHSGLNVRGAGLEPVK